ncbi:nuclear transport factor 2 family protein [Streptomyces sp. NPDC021218]|uniref:nuclear transport factor 2 family protein n=1 Tax=Streptomyces sp. NPDC021218 TaxID=3365119 RepID=UPI0037ADC0CF
MKIDSFSGYPNCGAKSEAVLRVLRHYALVDKGDFLSVVDLYAPDAVYYRPGYDPFFGRAAITDFYTRVRPIRDCRHTLTTAVAHGESVAVHGEFHGADMNGESMELRFSDFFVLRADNRFVRRDTFFFVPYRK